MVAEDAAEAVAVATVETAIAKLIKKELNPITNGIQYFFS